MQEVSYAADLHRLRGLPYTTGITSDADASDTALGTRRKRRCWRGCSGGLNVGRVRRQLVPATRVSRILMPLLQSDCSQLFVQAYTTKPDARGKHKRREQRGVKEPLPLTQHMSTCTRRPSRQVSPKWQPHLPETLPCRRCQDHLQII